MMTPEGDGHPAEAYRKPEFEELQRGQEQTPSLELMERLAPEDQAAGRRGSRVPNPGERPDAVVPGVPAAEQPQADQPPAVAPQTPMAAPDAHERAHLKAEGSPA